MSKEVCDVLDRSTGSTGGGVLVYGEDAVEDCHSSFDVVVGVRVVDDNDAGGR